MLFAVPVHRTESLYVASRWSRSSWLKASARSSGKKIRVATNFGGALNGQAVNATNNSTDGFAPGIVSASQCAHFTGK